MDNPFSVIFVITVFVLIASGILTLVSPLLGVSLPTAPTFPTLNMATSTNWLTQIGNTLYFVGQIIWYFISFAGYMITVLGVGLGIMSLGFIPTTVSSALVVLVGLAFFGSLLMYIRGASHDAK